MTKSSPPLLPSLSIHLPVLLLLCTNECFIWHWLAASQIDYEFRTLEWVIDYRLVSLWLTWKNMFLGSHQRNSGKEMSVSGKELNIFTRVLQKFEYFSGNLHFHFIAYHLNFLCIIFAQIKSCNQQIGFALSQIKTRRYWFLWDKKNKLDSIHKVIKNRSTLTQKK